MAAVPIIIAAEKLFEAALWVTGLLAAGVVVEKAIDAAKESEDVFPAEQKKACVICGLASDKAATSTVYNNESNEGEKKEKSSDDSKNEAAKNRKENIDKGIPESALGPSGKPKINIKKHRTKKRAKDAAQNRSRKGGNPEHHQNPTKGEDPHFHPDGKKHREHHTYPKKGFPGNEEY